MCNGNTLSVWIVKGLYISIYKFVYVCILYTWICFGLLKGLVVLSFALSNLRIKVPTVLLSVAIRILADGADMPFVYRT
jgi:hypothetical protein